MAGVSDSVHRGLCLRYGAGLAATEMVASDTSLWQTDKSASRFVKHTSNTPHCVQIVGYDPQMLAEAAVAQEQMGADIIDINMGCPAKKVCSKAAGSALLRDEKLVAQILEHVVTSVNIPVTLKIRTGWDSNSRNGVTIAKMAENIGVQALTVHGRTRACRFNGHAEYDTIADIKSHISIPLIANGDITSGQKAEYVKQYTGADALMIGRASQGNPFVFREINHYLETKTEAPKPSWHELTQTASEHLTGIHKLYGKERGYRIARKHIGWYFSKAKHQNFKQYFNTLTSPQEQSQALQQYSELGQSPTEYAA